MKSVTSFYRFALASLLCLLMIPEGQAQLKVGTGGQVGIKTTAPSSTYALDVNGHLRVRTSKIYGLSGNLTMQAGGSGYVEVKPKSPSYGLIVREYNSGDFCNLEVTAAGVGIGYNSSSYRLLVNSTRVEVNSTTDASGATNTGALEIGNTLRLDGNEIITNTNSTLYLQHFNNGDLRVDNSTFMVDASANRIGVNTTAPAYSVDVNGTMRVSSSMRATLFYDVNNTAYYCNPSSTTRLKYLYVNGTWISSDVRVKENIAPIDGALASILQLSGKQFDYKEDFLQAKPEPTAQESDRLSPSPDTNAEATEEDAPDMYLSIEPEEEADISMQQNQFGFIAQEVETVLPDLVHYDKEADIKVVNYTALIPVLVEAIKEQQAQIDALKAELAKR